MNRNGVPLARLRIIGEADTNSILYSLFFYLLSFSAFHMPRLHDRQLGIGNFPCDWFLLILLFFFHVHPSFVLLSAKNRESCKFKLPFVVQDYKSCHSERSMATPCVVEESVLFLRFLGADPSTSLRKFLRICYTTLRMTGLVAN